MQCVEFDGFDDIYIYTLEKEAVDKDADIKCQTKELARQLNCLANDKIHVVLFVTEAESRW